MATGSATVFSSDIPNGDILSDKPNVELDDMENVFLPDEIPKGDYHHPSVGFSNNYNVSPPSGSMQSQGVPSNDVTAETAKPSDNELLIQIREQLEYYFSKDNISSDKYLLSQMDGDHYVPISVLASFNQVKRLTSDTDTLITAIKGSSVLQIDAMLSKVRAIPEKRCILILREISKDTPKEEIEKLFSGENCPKTISCEFAENDCWYITFSDEDEAQEAHRYLREEVKEFHGNPIRARIKNVASQRTSTVPKSRPPYPYSMPMQPPMTFYPPQSPNAAPFGLSFFDPRYPPNQYPNGFPPQPGFSGGPGGNLGGRNYSVGSADRVERSREGVNNREGGVRRGSTGGSGKRYEDNKSGSGGGGYSNTRYNRREDDRIKNLPNRLRNKRNEELGHTPSTTTSTTNSSNDVVKEVGGVSGGSDYKKDNNRRQHQSQKYSNRPQPKLDFAPGNFPPLPTTVDSVAPPPPPPPPAVSEEGNPKLADIVKGKKQEKGNGSIPTSENKLTVMPTVTTVSATPSIETKTTQSNNTVSTTVTVTTTTTTATSGASVSTGKNTKYTESSKSNSNVKDSNNKSGTYYRSDKYTGHTRNTTGIKPANSSNNNRSRHKEYSNNNNNNKRQSSYTRPQKQTSPVAGKKPLPVSSSAAISDTTSKDEETTPTTQSSNELVSGNSKVAPEKLSYAQMAQQKPKPSPQKQSSKTTGPSQSAAVGESPSSPPPESSPPPQSITTITSESSPSP